MNARRRGLRSDDSGAGAAHAAAWRDSGTKQNPAGLAGLLFQSPLPFQFAFAGDSEGHGVPYSINTH